MAWKRVRGLGRLKPRQQQLGARIAAWRESEAMRANRPRKWILSDETLQDIARRPPHHLADLAKLRDIGQSRVDKYGQILLDIAQDISSLPDEALITRERKLTAEQEPLVDILMAVLRECARENALSVASLGKRADLEAMIAGNQDIALLKGWRLAAAGEALLNILQNKTAVGVSNGRLDIREVS
jgi:ribonuclease D